MKLGIENKNGKDIWFRDSRCSTLLLGKPETGIEETLLRFALNDIYSNRSIVFFDPTGKSIAEILDKIPLHRAGDVVLFDPTLFTFAFNPLADVPSEHHTALASLIVESIARLWPSDIITTRINNYVGYALRTLIPERGTTLFSIIELLSDKEYRQSLQPFITDKALTAFWAWFGTLSPKEQRDKTESTLTRIQSFMLEPYVRDCLSVMSNKTTFKDKIVLVSLSEAQLGTENTRLLGGLLMAQIALQGLHGLTTTLYVSGADRFPVTSTILKRCPSIPVFLAVHSLDELGKERKNVLTTVKRTLAFRTTAEDAKALEPEFGLQDNQLYASLQVLPDYRAYVLRGMTPIPLAMPEHDYPTTKQAHEIRKRSKKQYGVD